MSTAASISTAGGAVPTLIDALDPDTCFKWALFDRAPMKHWHRGRITLLGDACHPTLPFMAQGAAMAIEDAAALSRCIKADGIDAGLRHYESRRRARRGLDASEPRGATPVSITWQDYRPVPEIWYWGLPAAEPWIASTATTPLIKQGKIRVRSNEPD
ncbi:MAG: FAD-dependent monooxygenase [Gammaproteobacteria bacterium]|nr:FAD-dependent monooxygenase [Gammaproteobacteria bacterium]